MFANQVCQPESKLGVWVRWLETVYLPRCQTFSLHQMYEAMDPSEANRRELALACGTSLLATRIGSVNEVKQDVLSRPGRYL